MKVYPAIKAQMGNPEEGWTYYMVKMKMQDVAKNIDFVGELEVPKSTLEILQRSKQESRINSMIVPYLQQRPDRFFSSIIVACLGGQATFQPLKTTPTDDAVTDLIGKGVEDSIGLLSLDGGERYYALDGQHRLGAIKNIIDSKEYPEDAGSKFLEEDISVIILRAPTADEAAGSASDQWYRMFRRVFTSLNRYAKPTDRDTNILMDDDDIIAITTRELIETFGPFQWDGSVLENAIISLKGKNIPEGRPHLTNLQTLYEMNEIFLSSHTNEEYWIDIKKFKQKRPPDSFILECTKELEIIWQSLIDTIPDLSLRPQLMRINEENPDDPDAQNNLFFRPVFQQYILARLIRLMIDEGGLDINSDELNNAFKKINKLPSSLFSAPWRHLLITLNENGNWVMRQAGNDNAAALSLALELALWITEVIEVDAEKELELRENLKVFMPGVSKKQFDELWGEVLEAAK